MSNFGAVFEQAWSYCSGVTSYLKIHLIGGQWFATPSVNVLAHLGDMPPVTTHSVGIVLSKV